MKTKTTLAYEKMTRAGIMIIPIILSYVFIGFLSIGNADSDSSRKWLNEKENNSPIAPELVEFLKPLNSQFRLLHCKYDGSKLRKSTPFNSDWLDINGNRWKSSVKVKQVESDHTARDIFVQFQLDNGVDNSAGVAIAFDFSDWSTENYVMLPASVYNGNRCKIVDM